MELNRTIALLILAGLLMGLFGSFSFLSGMEPKFLIDVDGQRIALDDQQKSAFDKCGMFAQMFADCGSLEQINFEQLNSPVRIKTLQQLVRVINSPDTISTIINDGDCIDLYKLAEYFQAPQEIIKLTAEKAYLPVNKKIFELQKDNKEKASMEHFEILKEEIIKILDYYPHFVDFLKQCNQLLSPNLNDKRIFDRSLFFLNLSLDNLARCGIRKKIASIEEIDLLKRLNWTSHVRCLNIEGHALTSCSIKLLKQVFPNLKKIQCNNNQIFRVNETLDDSVERIELDDNPFTSITLSNADTFKNTEVIVDGSILEKVNFNPNINDKCKAWIKAFKIKSRIAAKSFARGVIEDWQEKIKVILPTLALVDVTGNILTNAHRWCIGNRLKYEQSPWKLLAIAGITYWIQISKPSIDWAFLKEKNPDKHGYFYSLRIKGRDHNSYKTQQVYPSPYMYNLFGKN